MIYSVVIDPRALQDIQAAIDYYDFKSEGLGSYFYQEVEQHFEILAKIHSIKSVIKITTDYH